MRDGSKGGENGGREEGDDEAALKDRQSNVSEKEEGGEDKEQIGRDIGWSVALERGAK